jgi:hypothetical protein
VRVFAGLLLFFAAFAPAKADTFDYTLNNPALGFTWSFEVPQILTNPDTIITNLSTAFIDPDGFLFIRGITTICFAEVIDPTGSPELFTRFTPTASCTFGGGAINNASTPINSLGVFILTGGEDITLTISSVPEPSGSLLLVASVAALLGLTRRHFPPKNAPRLQ